MAAMPLSATYVVSPTAMASYCLPPMSARTCPCASALVFTRAALVGAFCTALPAARFADGFTACVPATRYCTVCGDTVLAETVAAMGVATRSPETTREVQKERAVFTKNAYLLEMVQRT